VPGYHGANQDADFLAGKAKEIGYPVLIKARAGGGGKGMRLVQNASKFHAELASAQREGQASFGDAHVLIEKFITSPRHIEVQVFGDSHGNVVHLFERDCSLQRRHQKVIEEAPAPSMLEDVRTAMTDAATRAARQIDYEGAGTVEFIVDGSGQLRTDGFWFMEMNTRLQVEHPVTEAITGQDLVEWQLRVAAGDPLPMAQDELSINGHAFEARIYAEDPQNDFLPAPGTLHHMQFGPECRVDTGVRSGDKVSPFYDPMIAKLTSHERNRRAALVSLQKGLQETICVGTQTNLSFLSRLASDPDFAQENLDTGLIARKQDSLTAEDEPTPFVLMAAYLGANDLDPASGRIGWQLWGKAVRQLNLVHLGQKASGSLQFDGPRGISVIQDDKSDVFKNVSYADGHVAARLGSTHLSACVVKHGRSITVKISGEQYGFEVLDPLEVGSNQEANADSVFAPMTGIVSIINVSPADAVKKGDPLLVLEAMKMEHVMVAPRDGVVAEVLCAASGAVDEGSQLVVLEEVAE
jgi:3-methylcrotonyl-CoA carboxylase alpha subunit